MYHAIAIGKVWLVCAPYPPSGLHCASLEETTTSLEKKTKLSRRARARARRRAIAAQDLQWPARHASEPSPDYYGVNLIPTGEMRRGATLKKRQPLIIKCRHLLLIPHVPFLPANARSKSINYQDIPSFHSNVTVKPNGLAPKSYDPRQRGGMAGGPCVYSRNCGRPIVLQPSSFWTIKRIESAVLRPSGVIDCLGLVAAKLAQDHQCHLADVKLSTCFTTKWPSMSLAGSVAGKKERWFAAAAVGFNREAAAIDQRCCSNAAGEVFVPAGRRGRGRGCERRTHLVLPPAARARVGEQRSRKNSSARVPKQG